MLIELQKHFTERDHAFLMSFKRGQPDWALFDYPNAADLPAIRWKLQNINKLAKNQAKHQEQLDKLKQVLDDWLVNENAEEFVYNKPKRAISPLVRLRFLQSI